MAQEERVGSCNCVCRGVLDARRIRVRRSQQGALVERSGSSSQLIDSFHKGIAGVLEEYHLQQHVGIKELYQ